MLLPRSSINAHSLLFIVTSTVNCGQDIEGDEDRYLSTAQKQQKGLKDKGPPKHTKKLKPGPIQEINLLFT